MTITGTLTDDGASTVVIVGPGETLTAVLTVADTEAFEGIVAIEESANDQTWQTARDVLGASMLFTGTDDVELDGEIVSTTIKNTTTSALRYRVRVSGVEQDGIAFTLANVAGDILYVVLADRDSRPLASVRDDGGLVFHGPVVMETINGQAAGGVVNLDSTESVTTNGDTATEVSLSTYQTLVTTGGTDGDEDLTLGDAAAAVVGQRKLITLVNRVGTDTVVLDHANIVDVDGGALVAVELDADDEFILLESNGVAWQVIYHDATVTPD